MMRWLGLAFLITGLIAGPAAASEVRAKDLGRFMGWRDNALIGYGIVTGLSGSGDSPRNEVTQQALRNVLGRLGANVTESQIQSRNVAVVLVTATLPPSANVGDRIDVTVTSAGDARSLVGGTLLMTPLKGPDQRDYALAQGPLVVGGYRFEANQNLQQQNFPTTGLVLGGATVEAAVEANLLASDGRLTFILKDPDVTTAVRVAEGINLALGGSAAKVISADSIEITMPPGGGDSFSLISRIENVMIQPDTPARLVVNERTGTVVAGGDVRISSVVISQGDIRVSISLANQASQPSVYDGYAPGAQSLIVTNTRLDVAQGANDAVVQFPSTTVADLVEGLHRLHVDTRGVISILQAIRAAGALHAEIIVQ